VTCLIHTKGTCGTHDHGPPCPDCGARIGDHCTPTASRYAPWCCPACWHDQNPTPTKENPS